MSAMRSLNRDNETVEEGFQGSTALCQLRETILLSLDASRLLFLIAKNVGNKAQVDSS